jgi:type II secretory pathway pseudopilin PulG
MVDVPRRESRLRLVAAVLVGLLGLLAVSSWFAPTADARKKRKPAVETTANSFDDQKVTDSAVLSGGAKSSNAPSSSSSKNSKNSKTTKTDPVLVFPGSGKRDKTSATIASQPKPTLLASATPSGSGKTKTAAKSNRSDPRLRAIGFRSRTKLEQHYQKHGQEFGNISLDEYLAMAQDLRDAPLSDRVIEANQVGGTISRFDRKTGAFTAFDRDLTIRTFFKPNGGEDYFRRAATKTH